MANLRQTLRGADEIRYANPEKFNDTTTVKLSVKPKKAGRRSVYNVASSISSQRTVALPALPGCEDGCSVDEEVLSVRVNISGSVASADAVKALVNEVQTQLALIVDDLTLGFLPDNVVLPLGTAA